MNVLNSPYNKTTYATIAGAITTILFYFLAQYGIEPGIEVQGAVMTIIIALFVYFIPNKTG
jgi:quinol-cytochrome oxidoreductase complex cytochrome b subunit